MPAFAKLLLSDSHATPCRDTRAQGRLQVSTGRPSPVSQVASSGAGIADMLSFVATGQPRGARFRESRARGAGLRRPNLETRKVREEVCARRAARTRFARIRGNSVGSALREWWARRKPQSTGVASERVAGDASHTRTDRVAERRRAVALARHFREAEGLSIAEIAARLGRSPATVKAYFYDPTGEKARAVKARYVGVCRGCGAYTQPRNSKGDAYAYCKACHPGAVERRWTRGRVITAMLDWRARYGRLPSSYDWSRTHTRRRGGQALERLARGDWPAASVVTRLFGTWSSARAMAAEEMTREPVSAASSFGRNPFPCQNPGNRPLYPRI